MLKHRHKSSISTHSNGRLRHCSQGSNNSILDLIDFGELFSSTSTTLTDGTTSPLNFNNSSGSIRAINFHTQLSPIRNCASASVSTTALVGAFGSNFIPQQRWSSSSSSGGGLLLNSHSGNTGRGRKHKTDDDCGGIDDDDVYYIDDDDDETADDNDESCSIFASAAKKLTNRFYHQSNHYQSQQQQQIKSVSFAAACGAVSYFTSGNKQPKSLLSASTTSSSSPSATANKEQTTTSSTTFPRLSRRRPSANPAMIAAIANATANESTNSGSQEIMRRWNSFHSTRGECHPNRFRRNRKSATLHIDTQQLAKKLTSITMSRNQSPSPTQLLSQKPTLKSPSLSTSINSTVQSSQKDRAKLKSSNASKVCSAPLPTLIASSLLLQQSPDLSSQHSHGGRHSISYQSRLSISEGTKRVTKNWYLKRGKSLIDDEKIPMKQQERQLDNCAARISSYGIHPNVTCNLLRQDDSQVDCRGDTDMSVVSAVASDSDQSHNIDVILVIDDNNDDGAGKQQLKTDATKPRRPASIMQKSNATNQKNDEVTCFAKDQNDDEVTATCSISCHNIEQNIKEYIDDDDTPSGDISNSIVTSESLRSPRSLSSQTHMGFGKRNGGSCRRSSECFVLESSEMIVIEHPEVSSTNLGNQSSFFFQQHQKQPAQLQLQQSISNNRSNCCVKKNTLNNSYIVSVAGSGSALLPSSSSINRATVNQSLCNSIPVLKTSAGGDYSSVTVITNAIATSSPNTSNNNIDENNKIKQQLRQRSHSRLFPQSPLLPPATSVSSYLISPVLSGSNLIVSGDNTTTNDKNTSSTANSCLFGGSGVTTSYITKQLHHQNQHHQQSQQEEYKKQRKIQYLNTPSGINISSSLLYTNNQQHHRNSTPSKLCTLSNLGVGSVAVPTNQSNILSSNINFNKALNMDPHHIRHSGLPGNRPELYQKCNRGSHSSDTSSAYSGSDTMTSVHSSSLDADEVDLSGLVESVVDSDEEDLAESMDSLNVRDAVRDCLEKDPSERTEDDIEALLELTQGLKAFTNMTLAVRRALCSVMVFAVVDKAGTMVMSDGEELDSWSVLINGHVEIEHKNGEKEELNVGDSFGILPTMDKLYHRGVMRTKCDDCQFVCITQTDYYRIQHQGEENTKRHEDENGQVVMVTELRQIGPDVTGTNARRGHVVIRGTINRLMLQLIEENCLTDPTYVEDFLLTHRTFIDNPKKVAKQLLQWFENEDTSPLHTNATGMEVRDRVSRVILLWVNNHFTDFEMDPEMMDFLEMFEIGLERKQMPGQLRLLHIACAAKARTRNVTLTRSSRDEDLQFKVIGPTERGNYGIFVSSVEKKTKAEDVGLKRGDQILEVNGQSFEHVTLARAMEILMGSTHLSVTVKSNLLAFKEMLQHSDTKSPRTRSNRNRICVSDLAKLNSNDSRQTAAAVARLSTHELVSGSSIATAGDQVDFCQSPFRDIPTHGNINNSCVSNSFVSNLLHNSTRKDSNHSSNKGGFMTLGPKRRIQKALIKMNLLPKNNSSSLSSQHDNYGVDDDDHSSTVSLLGNKNNSDSKRLINSTINSHINNSNKSNSANNSNSSRNNSSTGVVGNTSATSSLYHSHSNPDLTSVISKSAEGTSNHEVNKNAQANSISNIHSNNLALNHASQIVHQTQPHTGTIYYEDARQSDYPEHVLKVYKSDQTCKYLLINKETTAHEVVMLALQEFGIHETSSNFSLCEVSVNEGGMIKQRRLPEHLQNLAERIGLSARYYLKTNGITETLVPDELAPDLVRESVVHLLQLNANEVAIQLTFQDFATFRQIESTEYVDDLFEIKSRYGTPMLKQFSELVNREMFWVVTEVCSEHNMVRRMKIVKQFIKIARHCKECRNFNSMFAIISGLGHASVSRLRQTWEKLPTKYQKLFNDLQDLMDPSRNMSKYRQLVSAELLAQHPIIPFYPVVKKDLTFIHLGNDTHVETLINFEKLRMIAKEVRILTHMCSTTYDLLTMLEFKGQAPSSAMVALNQMSVSAGPCSSSNTSNNSGSGNNTGMGSVISGRISGVSNLLYVGGGSATVKRRKKSTAAPNPKKMFEEAQMVRRVKAYLKNMKVVTDEDALHNLSLECEPSAGVHGGGSSSGAGGSGSIGGNSAPNTTITVRKRHPSPTLSTTSSTSSTSEGKKCSLGGAANIGPKFGTASPQSVKKILSLSESTKTRPHQPRHPGIQLPLVNVGSLHHPFSHSSISPSPSPGSHRRMGSCSSTSTASSNITNGGSSCSNNNCMGIMSSAGTGLVGTARGFHERSHSDTPTPLPSVDLSVESSSVSSLSNLPLRKNITLAGSVTSNDSGHGSCVQAELNSNCSDSSSSGLYHVASSIVHNSPSPTLQQRRHSSTHAGVYMCTPTATSPSPSSASIDSGISGKPPLVPPSQHSVLQQHHNLIHNHNHHQQQHQLHQQQQSFSSLVVENATSVGIPLTPPTPVSISQLTNNLQQSSSANTHNLQMKPKLQKGQQHLPHSMNPNNSSFNLQTNKHSQQHSINSNNINNNMLSITNQQQTVQSLCSTSAAPSSSNPSHLSSSPSLFYGGGGKLMVTSNSTMLIKNHSNNITLLATVSPTTGTSSSITTTSPSHPLTSIMPKTNLQQHFQPHSNCNSNLQQSQQQVSRYLIQKNLPPSITNATPLSTPRNLNELYNLPIGCVDIVDAVYVMDNTKTTNQIISNNSNNIIFGNGIVGGVGDVGGSNRTCDITIGIANVAATGIGCIANETLIQQQKNQQFQQEKQRQVQKQSAVLLSSNCLYSHQIEHQYEQQSFKMHHTTHQMQNNSPLTLNLSHATTRNKMGHNVMAPPPPKGPPRHPPAYNMAAQMARLHRLGRAHSHEGVTSAAAVAAQAQASTALPNSALHSIAISLNSGITGTNCANFLVDGTNLEQPLPSQLISDVRNGSNETAGIITCPTSLSDGTTSTYYLHSHNIHHGTTENDDEDAQVSAV